CGIGYDFPFSKILIDYGKVRKIGVFDDVPKDENSYLDLGSIKICCAKCIRKLRESENVQILQDSLRGVLIGD
ncbi:ABC-three component system protein, partial [Neobacillus vireti]